MPDIELNYKGGCDRCRQPLHKKLVEVDFKQFEIKKYADNNQEDSHHMGNLEGLRLCWPCARHIRNDATKNLGQDDPIERIRSC